MDSSAETEQISLVMVAFRKLEFVELIDSSRVTRQGSLIVVAFSGWYFVDPCEKESSFDIFHVYIYVIIDIA